MRTTITGLPALVLAVLVVAVAACGDDAAATTTAPAATIAPDTTTAPESVSGEPRDVSFVASGHTLEATLWPGDRRWVVLGHMLPADKSSWNGLAELLNEAGYSVLAYNNRGYGESEGPREPFALYADAAAAIAYAQENGGQLIVYGGASMNGANAISLGAFYEFTGIIALSAVPSFPSADNAIDDAYEVYEPTLFVAAEDDGSAVADLDRFIDRVPGDADAIILPDGGHGTDMLASNPDLGQAILDWLLDITG